MLLAEELDAPFEYVTAVAAPPNDKLYGNPLLGFQVTGGSTSVRAFWKPMRLAGGAKVTGSNPIGHAISPLLRNKTGR
jgi:isoquinoline 1-oxidoreductase subunit beta